MIWEKQKYYFSLFVMCINTIYFPELLCVVAEKRLICSPH